MKNVFEINRLGISDSFESGKSLTLGLDYKIDYMNENKDNDTDGEEKQDRYLEFKLATVIRDKVEKNIPLKSTIDKKKLWLFDSVSYIR